MLKLRDKLSQKRNVLMVDEEKPFLEHLDDLRKMLMRIVTTLLISVTLCFVFNAWFFKVVQYPMVRAGLASAQEKNRPKGIEMATWEQIHGAARGAIVLEEPVRSVFLSLALPDPAIRAYAEGYLIYCAAALLPENQRMAFLEEAVKPLPPERAAPVLAAAKAVLEVGPATSLEALKPVIQNVAMAPAEPFMLSMKLSTFAGIIVSFPLLFYYLLEFVLPGLNPREKRLLWPALAVGFGLFLTGVSFAFFLVVPNALEFFYEYGRDLNILSNWRIGDYISFVVSFCLIFGASFELPVIVMILVKLELLTSATMRRTRSWAIILIVVAGAILTPTGDIYTLSLLSGPMIVMYEACIWMALALEKKNARTEAEESERDMARRAALFGVATVGAARPGSSGGMEDSSSGRIPPGDASGGPSDQSDPHHFHDDPYRHEDHYHDDPHHRDDHWDGHPHHPDPDKPSADAEYEQYMREHAHLFPPAQTHPEQIPVEERGSSQQDEGETGSVSLPETPADPGPEEAPAPADGESPTEADSGMDAPSESGLPPGSDAPDGVISTPPPPEGEPGPPPPSA